MALRTLGRAFQDVWKEMWTILVVHLIFLFGNILIVPGPPVTVALFFYCNRIVHEEVADERDFLHAIRDYWLPAWRWGFLNFLVLGLLIGDYYLTGKMAGDSNRADWIQGLYLTLLTFWLLLQTFTLPFLFEQEQPLLSQALRNSLVFMRRNLIFVFVLGLLLALSLSLGVLAFMLTFAFGGALIAFAANRAVVDRLKDS